MHDYLPKHRRHIHPSERSEPQRDPFSLAGTRYQTNPGKHADLEAAVRAPLRLAGLW